MANDDLEPADESTEQTLSLPSLGFGRKRRAKRAEAAEEAPTEPVEQAEPAPEPVAEEPVVEESVAEEPAAAAEPAELTVVEPAAAEEPTVVQPAAEPEPTHVEAEPEPAHAETTEREPVAAGGSHRWASLTSAYDPSAVGSSRPAEPADADEDAAPRRRWSPPSLPSVELEGVSGQLAALVVGVAAGVLMVLGTILTMQGCDLVRGTSTCGGGPGFVLFVLLGAVVVVAATVALRAAGVAYAGTISFIAVALVVVVVAFLLLGVIFTAWMIGVIPVLSAAAFVLAHALSLSFGEYSGPEWR